MMDGATWGELGALFGFVVALGGVWWKWQGAIGRVDRDLQDYKLHVSETFATKAGVQDQTIQLLKAIESVGKRIDSMNERLDRAFERKQ